MSQLTNQEKGDVDADTWLNELYQQRVKLHQIQDETKASSKAVKPSFVSRSALASKRKKEDEAKAPSKKPKLKITKKVKKEKETVEKFHDKFHDGPAKELTLAVAGSKGAINVLSAFDEDKVTPAGKEREIEVSTNGGGTSETPAKQLVKAKPLGDLPEVVGDKVPSFVFDRVRQTGEASLEQKWDDEEVGEFPSTKRFDNKSQAKIVEGIMNVVPKEYREFVQGPDDAQLGAIQATLVDLLIKMDGAKKWHREVQRDLKKQVTKAAFVQIEEKINEQILAIDTITGELDKALAAKAELKAKLEAQSSMEARVVELEKDLAAARADVAFLSADAKSAYIKGEEDTKKATHMAWDFVT
ncbi:hypothetical protein SOVF_037140 isoform B [Spinacia oleracea]|nr:hypothetical protein SOVF_037140 isoform B [Spinacia oleracea]